MVTLRSGLARLVFFVFLVSSLGLLGATVAVAADQSTPPGALSAADLDDWLYVLQPDGAAGPPALATAGFDLLVIDPSADGSQAGEFTAAEITTLRGGGSRIVLAYLSIGEAEDYRSYWDPAWNDDPPPDPDAPSWLGPFNPLFPNNYKVRYWQPGWQAILFGTPSGPDRASLDRILDQGFDGVYLDIVDAFEFWTDEGERTRFQARRDMVDLIESLAAYGRARRPGFLVFPQNGADLVVDDDGELDALGQSVFDTIDGIGVEDLFYDGTAPQTVEETDYRSGRLAQYRAAGKVVIVVDYLWDAADSVGSIARYDDFVARARNAGFVPYAAIEDRDLDEILPLDGGDGVAVPQPRDGPGIFADDFESGGTGAW